VHLNPPGARRPCSHTAYARNIDRSLRAPGCALDRPMRGDERRRELAARLRGNQQVLVGPCALHVANAHRVREVCEPDDAAVPLQSNALRCRLATPEGVREEEGQEDLHGAFRVEAFWQPPTPTASIQRQNPREHEAHGGSG
jgi:hypothetical protein